MVPHKFPASVTPSALSATPRFLPLHSASLLTFMFFHLPSSTTFSLSWPWLLFYWNIKSLNFLPFHHHYICPQHCPSSEEKTSYIFSCIKHHRLTQGPGSIRTNFSPMMVNLWIPTAFFTSSCKQAHAPSFKKYSPWSHPSSVLPYCKNTLLL